MRKLIKWFVLIVLIVSSLPVFSKVNVMTDELVAKLETIQEKNSELIEINIVLKEELDSSILLDESRNLDSKKERRSYVVNSLKDFSERSQKDIASFLSSKSASQSVERVRPMWIANVINCFADKETILAIAERDDVKRIDFDDYTHVLIGDKVKKKRKTNQEQ